MGYAIGRRVQKFSQAVASGRRRWALPAYGVSFRAREDTLPASYNDMAVGMSHRGYSCVPCLLPSGRIGVTA